MINATTIEQGRLARLNEGRNIVNLVKNASSPIKAVLSFWKKLSKHWIILTVALFFDLLALIPFLCIVFNFIFGCILFIYFKGRSFQKTGLIMAGGSIVDFFAGILPVCLGATIIRILLKQK